ncbi:AbgT family transporter [Gemmatimonadales bacterium]|nr:AbgT family transporter [Gemmatimonadales bacterium]
MFSETVTANSKPRLIDRFLNAIELIGNKLPDPAVLFVMSLFLVWGLSGLMSGMAFTEIDPRSGDPISVTNLLTGRGMATFLAGMVQTFTAFPPLGVVLVAMLGIGVAEHGGYINAGLRIVLGVTPKALLTPMLILVAIVSHTATDAGYVLVIPIGGVIYYAAGRHPLAGIAAAFAGVSGGFSANFIPSGFDPLLQGFTQGAAQLIDPAILVNPLCNWFFTSASSVLIVLVGWYLTDRVVEPRLQATNVDADPSDMPEMREIGQREQLAFWAASGVMAAGIAFLWLAAAPPASPLRSPDGELAAFSAPLMQSIVPLIFLLFMIPGTVYGYMAGTFKESKDVIDAMTTSMQQMAYYIVMAFFCALFISAFGTSNLGALLAVKGANFLQGLALPAGFTIVGIIVLTGFVNLAVGSGSAKWALLAPIFVPMLMQLGISPELTQAAYRVGDSTTNIITPLMPYFPLVVVYCQRYVKSLGIGTLVSIMLPYSIFFMVLWSGFLLAYWGLGIPLGLQAPYTYPG